MMNNFCGCGRTTKDVELKYTEQGTAVGRFTLAINRMKDQTDFIPCVAFGKTADTLANYTKKGALIGIEGYLQTGSYQKDDGTKVFNMNVVVNRFSFLEKKQDNEFNSTANSTPVESAFDIDDDSLPF